MAFIKPIRLERSLGVLRRSDKGDHFRPNLESFRPEKKRVVRMFVLKITGIDSLRVFDVSRRCRLAKRY